MINKFLQLDKQNKVNIAVVGDLIIDEYYYVKADKLSPEFPIVRTLSGDESHISIPGGASNVALQGTHFNNDISLFGFVDAYSKGVLEQYDINVGCCCVNLPGNCHVPIKRRFYDHEFPLSRWDIEKQNYGMDDSDLKSHQENLYNLFCTKKSFDVVIATDYDKGVFALGGKKRWVKGDIPVIVDPKNGHTEDWQGCYIFKPNQKEAEQLSGLTNWQEQCKYFEKTLRCKSVIITHGDFVVGTVSGHPFEHKIANESDVKSVIGAGDAFVFCLASCIAQGMDIPEAAIVAHEFGGAYVQNKHNSPVYPHELLARIDPIGSKFVNAEYLKNRNYKLALANGCYDILHEGHLSLLQFAKSSADRLCVLVNSDNSIKKIKDESRPIIPLQSRMRMLASLTCVDFVCSFDNETPFELIKNINPEVLVKGEDWRDKGVIGSEFADEVLFCPLVSDLSTTKIIEKIREDL